MLGEPFPKPSEKCITFFIIPLRSRIACYFQAVLHGKSKLKSSLPLVVPQFQSLDFISWARICRREGTCVEAAGNWCPRRACFLPHTLFPFPNYNILPQLNRKLQQKQFSWTSMLIPRSLGVLFKGLSQPSLTVTCLSVCVSLSLDATGLGWEDGVLGGNKKHC